MLRKNTACVTGNLNFVDNFHEQCVYELFHPFIVERINNCVGEDNQYSFMLLLAYAYTLSLTTLVLDIMHMYYMPHCFSCDKVTMLFSGFSRFWVRGEMNRLTCVSVFLVSAYFRSGGRPKVFSA